MTMALVPMVLEQTGRGERANDIFSRLLRDNIIFIGTPINGMIANLIIAQMLFCSSETPNKRISLYINTPGGNITAGMAIYDTMQHVSNEVETVCIGQAVGVGALLLAGGHKGQRRALINSRILLHQPIGAAGGHVSDIERHAKEILLWRDKLNEVLAERTGQPLEKIAKDTNRDFLLSAQEAKTYGLIDDVLTSAPSTLRYKSDHLYDAPQSNPIAQTSTKAGPPTDSVIAVAPTAHAGIGTAYSTRVRGQPASGA